MSLNEINTLKDLHIGGHIKRSEVDCIARTFFNGMTQMAGPEGYLVTACLYDDLPDHIKGFIFKAILDFTVTNILDSQADEGVIDPPRSNFSDDQDLTETFHDISGGPVQVDDDDEPL